MIEAVERKECTGCKMCGDICPCEAISFELDQEGFWYPVTDYSKCIECMKCINVCPALNFSTDSTQKEPMVYAAWNLDDSVRLSSTSGGVYYALAENMIHENGYIVGCVYTDDYKSAVHIAGNNLDDLKRIMRSKYFQSDTAGIYRETEKLLQEGNKVLFCGTPCHIAGLQNYLSKDYGELLLTCDFICRGINSPKAFKKYLLDLEKKYNSNIKYVHLKNKSHGWQNLGTYIEFENGKKYYRDKINDPWVNGYVSGNLYMRPCCSTCKYKEIPRISDISLGDFWGLKHNNTNLYKGISVVLINSEKGNMYFAQAKERLYFEYHTLDEAITGNGCLLNSAPMGKKRALFFEQIDSLDFTQLVWMLLEQTRIKRIYRRIRHILHYIKHKINFKENKR